MFLRQLAHSQDMMFSDLWRVNKEINAGSRIHDSAKFEESNTVCWKVYDILAGKFGSKLQIFGFPQEIFILTCNFHPTEKKHKTF